MYALRIFCAAVAVWIILGGLTPQTFAEEPRPVTELVHGNNRFGLDLYGKLRQAPGNLFFSPYSISAAMAMAYGGARGETESQMAKVMHFGEEQTALHTAFAALQTGLKTEGSNADYQLNVANRLWGQSGIPFLESYLQLTQRDYGAALQTLDFAGAAEASRGTINRWVEEQTHEKIKDLLPPGSVDARTRLILTNAIYFLGNWASQFQTNATQDAPFFLGGGRETKAPMMYQKGHFRFAAAEGLQLLEMPYRGGQLAMTVLLPSDRDGLARLEESLSADKLDGWLGKLQSREVSVFVPKFKLTSEFTLNGTLAALGMTLPFSANADFSGMDGQRDLYISAVIHKAFVDVNESGTEAAAATGVMMRALAARPTARPLVFRADHPFVFLIRDTRTGSILFLGRITDPQG
jgi:serpin B